MYVADFADNGTFLGVIDKLDYLRELGINTIELMPIQESMGLDHDWGYLTRHFCALKTTYGTSSDLKQLVDQCHQRGIRVLIDAVFNHTATDCPLEMLDHQYWYFHDRHHPEDPCYWGPELNYEYYDEEQKCSPAVKFASDVVRYWIGEFHLDGIRFDAAKQMDNYDVLRELDSCFSAEEKSDYEISSFPQNGKWIDWLTNEEYQVENNRFKGSLRAFEGKVLRHLSSERVT